MEQRAQEQDLLRRCLGHDRGAWRQLIERYSKLIYGVIYETLRRHDAAHADDLAEELFHQTFLSLYDRNYRKLRQWSGRCSLASWIRLVTSSLVIDHLRRRRPDGSLDDRSEAVALPAALVDDSRAAQRRLEEVEEAHEVRAALRQLTPPDRELLLLLFRDERKPGEVARALGIKPGALYTRKNRALKRLRETILARREAEEGPDR